MMLSYLANAMFRYAPTSDAWKDFAADCRERLNVQSLTALAGVEAPPDFANYWISVVSGESDDYEGDGGSMIR